MIGVIGISGKIGSGKTTLAEYTAKRFQMPYVSFGNYVRHVAKERGIVENRENLQNLGQDLINDDIDQFCRKVLYFNGWDEKSSLILDGIRHVDVYESVKEIIFPIPIYLFYIDTGNDIRKKRLGNKDLENMDRHMTEYDVKLALPSLADLVIDGSLPLTQSQIEVDNWILRSGIT